MFCLSTYKQIRGYKGTIVTCIVTMHNGSMLLLLLLLAAMTYNQVHYFRINHLAGEF